MLCPTSKHKAVTVREIAEELKSLPLPFDPRGRKPRFDRHKAAALCVAKAWWNLSFAEALRPSALAFGEAPPEATLRRYWRCLAGWAEEAARRLAGPGELLVVDSTGAPTYYRGPGFKLHFVYDIERGMPLAVEVTEPGVADAAAAKRLAAKLAGGRGVVLADSAYFGRPVFEAFAGVGYLLVAKPRRPPRGGGRRGFARKLEVLFEAFRGLYRRWGEGERMASVWKARTRRSLFYRALASAAAHASWLVLGIVLHRLAA